MHTDRLASAYILHLRFGSWMVLAEQLKITCSVHTLRFEPLEKDCRY